MSSGRRIDAFGTIRVVFQQDNGDGFSMFAKLARIEPGENYEVEDQNMNCQTIAMERGRQARSLAIRQDPDDGNDGGSTYTFQFSGGTDVWYNWSSYSSAPCLRSTTCPGEPADPDCNG